MEFDDGVLITSQDSGGHNFYDPSYDGDAPSNESLWPQTLDFETAYFHSARVAGVFSADFTPTLDWENGLTLPASDVPDDLALPSSDSISLPSTQSTTPMIQPTSQPTSTIQPMLAVHPSMLMMQPGMLMVQPMSTIQSMSAIQSMTTTQPMTTTQSVSHEPQNSQSMLFPGSPHHFCQDRGEYLFFFWGEMILTIAFQEMIEKLETVGAVNWINVVRRATESVCTMFRDRPINIHIKKDLADKILAESIFDCMKLSLDYTWYPENSKYWKPH